MCSFLDIQGENTFAVLLPAGVNLNVWTYISVCEQSFNHRMVMSRDSFCFQHHVETDVCAVTVTGKNH